MVSLVDQYLSRSDWRVKENANRIFGYGGLKAYLAESIIARYALRKVYGMDALRAHKNGDIHIHDLGNGLVLYCCGYGVDKIIADGLKGDGIVSARPPKHFSSALGQIMNFIFMIQQEQAGAVGLNCFDTYLAPFIKHDGLTEKQVEQYLQEFLYSVNMPLRAGLESPFVNLTFDASMRDDIKEQAVIIGGELKDNVYGEYENEMLLIDKLMMKLMYDGDASGRVFTFPILTVNITSRFDWESEFGIWLKRITAKYGIPYFQNMINSDMKPEDVMAFCCRLRSDLKKVKRYGGIFGNPNATGSIGVVTINMARLGYLSASEEKKLYDLLNDKLVLIRDILNKKRAFILKMMDKGLYPMIKRYLGHLNWHFNTVSIVGMHECLLNMNVEDGICSENGLSLAENVLRWINDVINEFEKEDNVLWNFEQAPAESASGRLKQLDVKMFDGKMKAIEIMGKKMPYTNSTHVPVNYTDDLWFILRHQERLNKYYTGGSVVHIWLGERIDEWAVKEIVDRVCRRTTIPYFSLTPTFSVCNEHGYLSGEMWKCPICGKECEVYSRVVGYYKPVQNWNEWKQVEFKNRKNFYKF